MEQVVTQLQQELFSLRARVAAESGLADAVRAINNLAIAQVRKDTPSLIDLNGLGRPKEFSGGEEDFQQWSKKTEAFFSGVIKESEMNLEWAAEQTVEITTTAICRVKKCGQRSAKPGVCAADAHDAHGSRCRQLAEASVGGMAKRYDPTTGGRKRNLLRTIISPRRCSHLELQAGIERWESHVSRYEKKLKDKLDDEIKLAGLEALVPEELEKHLMLNSNCLRTFEDARLEIVTYVGWFKNS